MRVTGASNDRGKAELQLEFKCFLVDNKTGNHVPVRARIRSGGAYSQGARTARVGGTDMANMAAGQGGGNSA